MLSWWRATSNASPTTPPTLPRMSSSGFWEPMSAILRRQRPPLPAQKDTSKSKYRLRLPRAVVLNPQTDTAKSLRNSPCYNSAVSGGPDEIPGYYPYPSHSDPFDHREAGAAPTSPGRCERYLPVCARPGSHALHHLGRASHGGGQPHVH